MFFLFLHQILLQTFQIVKNASFFQWNKISDIQFFIFKMLWSDFLPPLPEFHRFLKGHKITRLPVCKIYQEKTYTSLFFKLFHKINLVFMDILKRKNIRSTFFGVKTYWNPLHNTNIIHGAFLIKIRQGNIPSFFIKPYRLDRRRNLLYQSQVLTAVFFIGIIYQFLQNRTSQSFHIPASHTASPISSDLTRSNFSGSGAWIFLP